MPGVHEMGNHYGAVLVRLCVDGESEIVSFDLGRSDPFAVLDQAIETLRQTRAQLERVVPPRSASRGGHDSRLWGRRQGREGHSCHHPFPTRGRWGSDPTAQAREAHRLNSSNRTAPGRITAGGGCPSRAP